MMQIMDSPTSTPETTGRLEHILLALRQRGCRLTPQRAAILRAVLGSPEHPTAEQIFAQVRVEFPMTSLATVYNTLGLLKEMGAVLEIGPGHSGMRYDGLRPEPHPHLICTQCHIILDADLPELQALGEAVSQATGFRITSHRFDFFGLCPQCQQRGNN
jgi:Fur family peroxide stress response transcriptional regulator